MYTESFQCDTCGREIAELRNATPGSPVIPDSSRDERQQQVHDWCASAFGAGHAASIPQRGIRHAEEAIEAAQAAGCDIAMVHKLVDHVYSNPPGKLSQEIGGSGITLLALAQAAGLSADGEEARELARVLAKPLAHFAARNQVKNDAGFNVDAPAVADTPTAQQLDTREREYFFQFPSPATDHCGPYRSIEEMKKDSAWNDARWKRVWRYRAIPAGPWNEVVDADTPSDKEKA